MYDNATSDIRFVATDKFVLANAVRVRRRVCVCVQCFACYFLPLVANACAAQTIVGVEDSSAPVETVVGPGSHRLLVAQATDVAKGYSVSRESTSVCEGV